MAAPADAARNATNVSTAALTWAVTVGSPAAGTLLIVFLRGSTNTLTSFTGYTQLAADASDASDDQTLVYYRQADGTEGATDDAVWNANTKGGAICWQVTGAIDPATSAPTISAVAIGTTTANTCNPNSVAPANAPQDTLYIAMGGEDGEVGAFTAAPANYGNFQAANSGTGGAAASNLLMGGASRQILASSSDDPGAFTHAAANAGWTAFTVAIIPPAAAAAFVPYVNPMPQLLAQ